MRLWQRSEKDKAHPYKIFTPSGANKGAFFLFFFYFFQKFDKLKSHEIFQSFFLYTWQNWQTFPFFCQLAKYSQIFSYFYQFLCKFHSDLLGNVGFFPLFFITNFPFSLIFINFFQSSVPTCSETLAFFLYFFHKFCKALANSFLLFGRELFFNHRELIFDQQELTFDHQELTFDHREFIFDHQEFLIQKSKIHSCKLLLLEHGLIYRSVSN